MSSCCGGNCGCGSGCKCGDGCRGCKMYPDMSYAQNSSSETLVMGVGAPKETDKMEGGEMGVAGADNGCKCGSNCTCDPCTCNKRSDKMEGGERGVAGADNGCKCGSNCTCDPCTCNK